jgi:hypothetical protein
VQTVRHEGGAWYRTAHQGRALEAGRRFCDRDREPNLHFQATTVSIARANAAAMDDCYSLRDRQAQTSSAGLMLASFRNPVKRLKNTTEGLLWHA